MAMNKRDVKDIDEKLLLSAIRGKTLEATEPDKPKKTAEIAKQTRPKPVDYSSTFLQKNELKTRHGVYISRDMYETVFEIVRVIAGKEVTVGGYIENVLTQHLESYKVEINELYKKERKDLIP